MEEKNVKNYEIAFLVKKEDGAKEIAEILNSYKADILKEGGVEEIRLAFPIKKENSAYFGHFSFLLPSQDIMKLNDAVKINPKILRFSINASPVVRQMEAPTKNNQERKSFSASAKAGRPIATPAKKAEPAPALTNEALEKKLEEILK